MTEKLSIKKVIEELYKIPFFGKAVGLLNIECIYKALNEEYELEDFLNQTTIVHVAGTNGKGSTCRFMSSIYKKSGYSIGLFTSPHMDVINERIEIDGRPVRDDLFIEAYQVIREIVRKMHQDNMYPTFFEWLFGMYLYSVQQAECEVLIIEVGIGGRLDTTNVLKHKALSVITSIGMDHQNILGNTLEAIAKEKAGIIRKDIPTVCSKNEWIVKQVIKNSCRDKQSLFINSDPSTYIIHKISEKKIDFSIYNKYYYYDDMQLNLTGIYQLENLNLALTAIEYLQKALPVKKESIYEGVKNFYIPGRFEVIGDKLILDGAHNPLGVNKLIETLKYVYNQQTFDLFVGVKEGKDYKEILQTFINSNLFEVFYVCQENFFNSVDLSYIITTLNHYHQKYVVVDDLTAFIYKQLQNDKRKILVAAGSLYLISSIRAILKTGGYTHDSI